MPLECLTISQINQGLQKKQFSCLELTEYYLTQISLQKSLNAFITVLAEQARQQAKIIDAKINRREKLPLLAGVPCAIKDLILIKGVKTTAGSKILANYLAPYDATVVTRLNDQGAIFLGKNNCDEFAMGSSNENSAFGPVSNPYVRDRVPGGSSGGSAVAVAADMCAFALGSDTGGSIRQPAAFCGVVGLKPTYGRVSRYGLIAMTSSLDQIGPITRCVEDAAMVFEVIAGFDENDRTTVMRPKENYLSDLSLSVKGKVIGVPKEYYLAGMSPEIEKAVKEAIDKFKELGALIKEVSLPHTSYALAVYYLLMPAEVSSNLARFDGIKYGFSSAVSNDLQELYHNTRADGFGSEVKRRAMIGTYVLSAGYKAAYYAQAKKVQQLIQQEYVEVFKGVDALITPTTPTAAFKKGEKFTDPLTMYLSDIFTVSANIAGLCGISIPAGQSFEKLPIGLQILGAPFAESKILQLAYQFQEATPFHCQRP